MPANRNDWVIPVAEQAAAALRTIRAQGRNPEADMMRRSAESLFSTAIYMIGTVSGPAQQEIERLVLDEELPVDAALRAVGC